MATLRQELRDFLVSWRSDLSRPWSHFFDCHEPDLDEVDRALMSDPLAPIIPGRRSAPREGAPEGAHVFRTFDGVDPAHVSVIVVGQDPYPRASSATGRAFEDGGVTAWDACVSKSLQRLMQSAVSLRYGRPELGVSPQGWTEVVALMRAGTVELEPIGLTSIASKAIMACSSRTRDGPGRVCPGRLSGAAGAHSDVASDNEPPTTGNGDARGPADRLSAAWQAG